MKEKNAPIGVFDSGLGGISVLKRLKALLPGEDFVFFGDRKMAPYGNRPAEEVEQLSRDALSLLKKEGCKAMVIACNTATGVAADLLRAENPDFPIVAIEPALKPAVAAFPEGRILLMATPLAIKTPRIQGLAKRYGERAELVFLPCPGLVELIEEGHLSDELMKNYLKELFGDEKPDAVVLGCTHYPHAALALREHFGEGVVLFDGGEGTARRTKEVLEGADLCNPRKEGGKVRFIFSEWNERTLELANCLLSDENGKNCALPR